MDYLSPLYQEAAYCLGVERLLGITDDDPRAGHVIRVLLMELNRVSSHLVALATGGMEIGALTVMTVGFRLRERVLEAARAHHRPADEPRVHPARRARAGPPARRARRDHRRDARDAARTSPTSRSSRTRTRWCARGWSTSATSTSPGAWRSASPGPCCAPPACRTTCAASQPYCGYENYEFDVVTWDTCDAYGRLRIRIEEMRQSLRIVEQCVDRLRDIPPGPVMVADKKIAWPAQLAIGGDGMGNSLDHIREIMGKSMEALIHHFKLVTEGFRVPAGQVYSGRRVPARRARRAPRLRRRHPAVPGALPRPLVRQPAGRGGDVRGRPGRRRHRRGGLARPRDGWGGPLMPLRIRHSPTVRRVARARLAADAQAIIARYPVPRSALLPMLHLVQSEEGFVSPDGIAFCAEQLGLTTAEVAAVATFYTMYKRHPNGTTRSGSAPTPCARSWAATRSSGRCQEHLGVGHDETTADGAVTLEHIECNAACDYAPVVMVNWEFFDNQTPASARDLADQLRAGEPVDARPAAPPGVHVQADVPGARRLRRRARRRGRRRRAGHPARALRLAKERGWTAPESAPPAARRDGASGDRSSSGPVTASAESTARGGVTSCQRRPGAAPDSDRGGTTAGKPPADATDGTADSGRATTPRPRTPRAPRSRTRPRRRGEGLTP